MSSDDIANLYRQFGGQPDNYQELGRDNVVRQSRERWPMLANVRQQEAARTVRPVSADTGTPAASEAGPLATVFDEAAARTAAEEARGRPPIQARARPVMPAAAPAAMPAEAPIEPVLSAEPLPSAPAPAPVVQHPLPPFAGVAPRAAPAPHVAPADNELQGVFARLARPPEPVAAPASPQSSLLRRLLRP